MYDGMGKSLSIVQSVLSDASQAGGSATAANDLSGMRGDKVVKEFKHSGWPIPSPGDGLHAPEGPVG